MPAIWIAVLLSFATTAAAPGQERAERLHLAVGNFFSVSFDGPQEAELATRALASLEKAYWRISQTLNVYPPSPIPVVLYTTQEFRDVTRAPAWAAGAYDGTIRVPMRGALARPQELDRVMAHEFTHAVVRLIAARGVPTWLNEGLAAALEDDSIDWATNRIERAGGPLPLMQLRSSFGPLGTGQAELAYSSSAVAVRRLLDEAGGVAMSNLLRDLGEGDPFDAAFARRMNHDFAAFAASLETRP